MTRFRTAATEAASSSTGAPLSDNARQDVIQQITEAWKNAQAQLEELREAVERTGQMAQLKVQSEFTGRDLDRAYRDLGEAVWAQVKKGSLELPRALSSAAKAVEEVERKLAAQAADISDILSEGREVAGRIRAEKKGSAKTPLAAKGKKR